MICRKAHVEAITPGALMSPRRFAAALHRAMDKCLVSQ